MRDLKQTPLRLGILGCGSFVKRRILPLLQDLTLLKVVALQKQDLSQAEQIAKEFNILHAVSKREDLLSHPPVEAVYVATPNVMHEADVLACAQFLKPTLCEKPLAPFICRAIASIQAFYIKGQRASPRRNFRKSAESKSLFFPPCSQRELETSKSSRRGCPSRHWCAFNRPDPFYLR